MKKFILFSFMVLAVSAWSIPAAGTVLDPVPDKDKVKWAVPVDCIPQADQMSTFLPSGQAVADAVLPTVETLFTPTPCSNYLGNCFNDDVWPDNVCWAGWCICVWIYYAEEEC